MSANDHAILIGINHYPEFGEGGGNADLRGPANDVDSVKEWLLDPRGGALASEQYIHVIKSPGGAQTAAAAHPTADELERAFLALHAIANKNMAAGRGSRVGERLYLFMSGHGFSPGRQRGCLYTANAQDQIFPNIHATGWLNWLQDAAYFREFVLWMDCCMNRMSFVPPHDPPWQMIAAREPPRANFVAFAAQRPLKAVEVEIAEDEGKTHGAFTWVLLEGLRGAAADEHGRVTGRSLADWIRNAQAARMAQGDRDDGDVAKEPEVIQEDAGLIFVRGVAKPKYRVSLSFPAGASPGPARIWSGMPPRIVEQFLLDGAVQVRSLQPGLYLVEVPTAGLRQGFEVLTPGEIVVDEQGPAVLEGTPASVFELTVRPGDPAAEIFVIDSRFSLVEANPAVLSTPLLFGLYKIKTRIGRSTHQHVILLDRDGPAIGAQVTAQPATVVPIKGTAASHEYHRATREAAVNAARALGVASGGAAILLMARAFSGPDAPVGGTQPWKGISVVDAGGAVVLDLQRDGKLCDQGDPCAYGVKALAPGCYFLRQRLDDGAVIEQSLIVCKSWRLEVYVLRRVGPGKTVLDVRPRVSVMMRRLDDGPGLDDEDRLVETARVALADERHVLNAELKELLLANTGNPIAGIIGGQLLLVERDRDPGHDISQLDVLVRGLRSMLGAAHPDVAALALQCSDSRLRRSGKLMGPPMFQRSWSLLVRASQKRRSLVPVSIWNRVQAQGALPPFLMWCTSETVKSAVRTQLVRAIKDMSPPPKLQRPDANAQDMPLAMPERAFGVLVAKGNGGNADAGAAGPSRVMRARAAQLQVPPSALDALLRSDGAR